MGRHYSTRDFLRQMPNALLARYFQARGVLYVFDFASLKETQPEPLLAALNALPEAQRNPMVAEFREIQGMSDEKGFRAIINEAEFHLGAGTDGHKQFVQALAVLPNHFERAMVVFLDHGRYWRGATLFHHADLLPNWRKRKNFPHGMAAVDPASIRELADLIRHFFHYTEGRGNNCQVEALRRGDRIIPSFADTSQLD